MKKNIIVLVSAMNMGGAQRVVSILCNHWSSNGHNVTLISTYTDEQINHFHLDKNINLKYLDNSPYLSKNNIFNIFCKLIFLRRLIKSHNPDLVISFLTRVNVATALSSIGIKSPIIICERSWPPFLSLSNGLFWFYRALFKRVSKIIVQTDKSKSWLNTNFSGLKVEVIPNPIIYPLPANSISPVDPNTVISQYKKIILASGRMHKFKQFDMLIKSFSMIKDDHPDWNLIILGDGEGRDELNSIILELGLSNRVYLPGNVGNMSHWYKRADLFVLSSILEGFPNVLLEAMAYGVPSISFDCNTGPRDMIQNEINGILVNPDEKEVGSKCDK